MVRPNPATTRATVRLKPNTTDNNANVNAPAATTNLAPRPSHVAPRTPHVARRSSHPAPPASVLSSLPLRCKGAVAEADDGDLPLHRVLALDGAGVHEVQHGSLRVHAELEADVQPFDSAGEVRFTELPGVVPRQLLALLFERHRRRARPGGRLAGEDPFPGHVDLGGLAGDRR